MKIVDAEYFKMLNMSLAQLWGMSPKIYFICR